MFRAALAYEQTWFVGGAGEASAITDRDAENFLAHARTAQLLSDGRTPVRAPLVPGHTQLSRLRHENVTRRA